MHFFVSIIVTFCLILIILGNNKLSDNKTLFFIVSFSIILTSIGIDWLYQGLEEYHYITIRSIIFSITATFSIFIFIHNKNDYVIYAAISILSSLGSSILNFIKARKIIFSKRTRPLNFNKHLRPLGVTYLMSFASSIYLQLDTVMLGFLSTPINVGYYSTSTKLTKMFLSLISSIGTVLLPRLSYYIANNLRSEFDRMLKKSISIILLLCIPSVVSMMMLSKEIIQLIAGSKYLPAASCVVITAPIIFFIGLTNIFGLQILYPLGKERLVAISSIIGAFISIGLNFFLIPHFTYVGAALTTLITEFVIFMMQFFMVRRIYPIAVPLRNLLKYIIATLFLIVLLIFVKIFFVSSLFRLMIAIPLGVILYFGLLIIMKEIFVQDIINRIRKV